jgi:hypothetical protein
MRRRWRGVSDAAVEATTSTSCTTAHHRSPAPRQQGSGGRPHATTALSASGYWLAALLCCIGYRLRCALAARVLDDHCASRVRLPARKQGDSSSRATCVGGNGGSRGPRESVVSGRIGDKHGDPCRRVGGRRGWLSRGAGNPTQPSKARGPAATFSTGPAATFFTRAVSSVSPASSTPVNSTCRRTSVAKQRENIALSVYCFRRFSGGVLNMLH